METVFTERWATMAKEAGYYADVDAQDFQLLDRSPQRALGYASKGLMARHGDSRTPGRILRDAALHGDADAAADWIEIEQAYSVGRRLQAPGGQFRKRKAPDAIALDFDQLVADQALDRPFSAASSTDYPQIRGYI